MQEVDPGHKYELDVLDGSGPHLLTFVKREGNNFPGNVGHYKGTNLQEVLRAMIARVKYLDKQIPCMENKEIINQFRYCILRLEGRAARRHGRLPDEKMYVSYGEIEALSTCGLCRHIGCEGNCHGSQPAG
jgi:hypothetical protein